MGEYPELHPSMGAVNIGSMEERKKKLLGKTEIKRLEECTCVGVTSLSVDTGAAGESIPVYLP